MVIATHRRCHSEGYQAFDDDLYPDSCPYAPGTDEHKHWMLGWEEAYDHCNARNRPQTPGADFMMYTCGWLVVAMFLMFVFACIGVLF